MDVCKLQHMNSAVMSFNVAQLSSFYTASSSHCSLSFSCKPVNTLMAPIIATPATPSPLAYPMVAPSPVPTRGVNHPITSPNFAPRATGS